MKHVMTGIKVLRRGLSLVMRLFPCEEAFSRNGSPGGLERREGDAWTWKVFDYTERGD